MQRLVGNQRRRPLGGLVAGAWPGKGLWGEATNQWDAPGCGGSADPPAKWRLPDYANCLAGLIKALHLGRPHVGGLSWGGGLALELYRRHPQVPRSLVLASAYAGWAGSLPARGRPERLRQVMREAKLPPAQWVPGYLLGLFTDAAPAELVDEALAIMLQVRPGGMRPTVQGFAEADLREVLPRIQVPTLLLYGDADRPLAPGGGRPRPARQDSRLQASGHAQGRASIRHGGPRALQRRVRSFLRSVQRWFDELLAAPRSESLRAIRSVRSTSKILEDHKLRLED